MKIAFRILSFSFIFLMICQLGSAQNSDQTVMLEKINKVREKGCNCSGKYMRSAKPLTWSKTLMTSALHHARDMERKKYFSHYSPNGEDIGDRLDAVGYKWSYCGENLGSGQKNFDEVLDDWIASKSHCMMLMNTEVEEIAIASSGKYWVQHFAKRFDERTFGSN